MMIGAQYQSATANIQIGLQSIAKQVDAVLEDSERFAFALNGRLHRTDLIARRSIHAA
jgi:hypothetical protein